MLCFPGALGHTTKAMTEVALYTSFACRRYMAVFRTVEFLAGYLNSFVILYMYIISVPRSTGSRYECYDGSYLI